MSRIGKKPIAVPAGVTLKQDGRVLTVSGPKGKVTRLMPPLVELSVETGLVTVVPSGSKDRRTGAMWGLARTLVANMVQGVVEPFAKTLLIEGTGYKAQMKGSTLVLSLGFSHPIEFNAPEGVTVKSEKPTEIHVSGVDKEMVGQVAAEIRAFREPDAYKGKGVRYAGEVIIKKVGKSGAK
jgi:large subunit ribosomal protein L6